MLRGGFDVSRMRDSTNFAPTSPRSSTQNGYRSLRSPHPHLVRVSIGRVSFLTHAALHTSTAAASHFEELPLALASSAPPTH